MYGNQQDNLKHFLINKPKSYQQANQFRQGRIKNIDQLINQINLS